MPTNHDLDTDNQGGRRIWLGISGLALLLAFGMMAFRQNDQADDNTDLAADPPTAQSTDSSVAQSPVPATPVASRTHPVEVLSDGFASSSACVECHKEEHASWHASYHRTMTQEINVETAPDAIRDTSVTVEGRDYQFEQSGDQFYVTFPDPLVFGKVRRRKIVMMTGSHHMHVLWYATDAEGTPGELDIVYLKGEQRWIPRLSSFLRPPVPEEPQLGTWNRTCSKCHATHARERFQPESRTWDTHVAEFGIACEACHGQGADHIIRHKAKNESLAASDKIVSPGSISQQASVDVCGRCHSVSMPDFDSYSMAKYRQDGNPFEPGQLLAECTFNRIIRASPEHRETPLFEKWSEMEDASGSFWADGMARVTGREYNSLVESACFKKGEMTCLSCHTMHPSEDQSLEDWRDDQLKPGMRGDQACLQCHEDFSDKIEAHTHHAATSSGSRCQNCHMPHTTFGLLKTIRSHQVSSPSVKASLSTDRPSACTLCHLDKTFTWTTKYLHEWYDQPEIKVDANADAANIATSVIHFLKGDAAQRAIQASAYGWEPAREASGTDWMEPFLMLGANDPYDAIRIISARSLRSLPDKRSPDIDALAPESERMQSFNSAVKSLIEDSAFDPRPEVLIDEDGKFDFRRTRQLMDQRNHSPVGIRE